LPFQAGREYGGNIQVPLWAMVYGKQPAFGNKVNNVYKVYKAHKAKALEGRFINLIYFINYRYLNRNYLFFFL
jgi:hypothetical protein